ncbi:hypothetical protein SAMN04489724_3230 [Algoriphagus locisalis]|uniref:6-bladed beta-propeller protein n=1 Tax=Algoriphagus locisalis TaxID=305507 RepID=A0A1I7CIC4_9BACT|nr:hypothetical protein [Algoriphagus locisalis]SFT99188.1 hypothetical protein SAMN04489724_3230 [Algoriphagus locisalis]
MKSLSPLLLLLLFAFTTLACSAEKEEAKSSTPLSEQNFEFIIYDSLVVDYLGNLFLADITEDGKSFLLIDQQTDTLFVTDGEGTILSKFKRLGDGPGFYKSSRLSLPSFLNTQEIIVPAQRGLYLYSLSGEPTRSFLPEYAPSISLITQFINNSVIRDDQVFYPWQGRLSDEFGVDGKEFQLATHQVEFLDIESGLFSPAIPFPESSKFKTGEKTFLIVNYHTVIASSTDTLYVAFRNEPVIYGYSFSDLTTPSSVYPIPFEEFIQKAPKDEDHYGTYDMKDIYLGAIQNLSPTENQRFLLTYNRGLTDQEYEEIIPLQSSDPEEFRRILKKINTFGQVLFDGKSVSKVIQKPESLGFTFKFISEEEIWFTPNFEHIENDYSVIYKTRIVTK